MTFKTLLIILTICLSVLIACLITLSWIIQTEKEEEYLNSIERTEGIEKRLQKEFELKEQRRIVNSINRTNYYNHRY